MTTPLICDATTSSGRKCKISAEGTINGRNYCGIQRHKTQVEAAADVDAVVAEEAAALAEALSGGPLMNVLPADAASILDLSGISPVREEATPAPLRYNLEQEAWEALAQRPCPGKCGHYLSFWGEASADPQTKLLCTNCNCKVTMSGQRWT